MRICRHLIAQPQPYVERNLLVAAAAGVDLVRHRAGMRLQLANHQRVYVFVGRAVEELGLGCFFANLIESVDDSFAFVRA